MKFYIATRFSDTTLKNKAVTLKRELEKRGHEMTFDWTEIPQLRPYEENAEQSQKYAEIEIRAAMESDFFILLPCPNGTGMYTEYGAALAKNILSGSPKIYILGDQKECLLFNFHPAVQWIGSLEEIPEM